VDKSLVLKILEIAINLLVLINVSLTAWCLTQVVELKKDVAVLQKDTMNSEKALEIWQAIANVKMDMSRQGPPAWLVEKVTGIEVKVDKGFDKIEARLEKIAERSGAPK
jgi:hypothetical protein